MYHRAGERVDGGRANGQRERESQGNDREGGGRWRGTPSLLRREPRSTTLDHRAHKSFIRHRPFPSARLFSNILIYAAFAGLIWRASSFICAFRGEICPTGGPGVARAAGTRRARPSFPESTLTMRNEGESLERIAQRRAIVVALRRVAGVFFYCSPSRMHRGRERERWEVVAKPSCQWDTKIFSGRTLEVVFSLFLLERKRGGGGGGGRGEGRKDEHRAR